MKNRIIVLAALIFLVSLACQLFVPTTAREGTVISDCAEIVSAVTAIQPTDIPDQLMETGIKQGDEFDVNDYFTVLKHISMQDGYVLDYVYSVDFLGSLPYLYARPVDQAPYASLLDIPEGAELGNYRDQLKVEDVAQGYFEYAVMDIMARQFYLVWHANYNDTEIVCNAQAAAAIVDRINSQDFGMKMDLQQQAQIRAMKNVEPAIIMTEDKAILEIVVFSKWGGFFRRTYTIDRSFPHAVEVKDENLVPYDCGVMF
ncbi:MAG: hypothetical protein ACOYZ6_03470 [Chloroflexota bacterium]